MFKFGKRSRKYLDDAPDIVQEIVQCEAGVDDVFDDQDVLALDVALKVFHDAKDATGGGVFPIAGPGDKVHGGGDAEVAHEVGEEDEGAVEDTNEDGLLVAIVAGDLSGQLFDLGLDLLFGDEDFLDVGHHGWHLIPTRWWLGASS